MNENFLKNSADIFVEAARDCLDTPFHHQGRKKEIGLDCIGLVVVALRALSFKVIDRLDYGPRPDGVSLVDALVAHGAKKVNAIQKGDILLFRYDHQPQHVAIASSPSSLIHAFAPAHKVVETHIGPYWRRRIFGIYRFTFDFKDGA